jgi:phosphohistidine phosphatase SixA
MVLLIASQFAPRIAARSRRRRERSFAYLPPFPETMPKLQQSIAKSNEFVLYALILLQLTTGFSWGLFGSRPFELFIWRVPALWGPNPEIHRLFAQAHEFGAKALVALIGLHAGAALLHVLVLRDGVLQRMLPSTLRPTRADELGATFPDQADTDALNFDNIGAQRDLDDKGEALAKTFGEALRQAEVPIGKVYTSKYNRAYETAVLAGFRDIEKTTDLTEGGLIVSPNENSRRAEAFRKMLATAADPHANTLITHQPNIVAALGKDWFDVKEGEASTDGSYKLVARVQMDEWKRIAAAAR